MGNVMKELLAAAVLGYLGWRYLASSPVTAEATALTQAIEQSPGNYVITGTPQLPPAPPAPVVPPTHHTHPAQEFLSVLPPVRTGLWHGLGIRDIFAGGSTSDGGHPRLLAPPVE